MSAWGFILCLKIIESSHSNSKLGHVELQYLGHDWKVLLPFFPIIWPLSVHSFESGTKIYQSYFVMRIVIDKLNIFLEIVLLQVGIDLVRSIMATCRQCRHFSARFGDQMVTAEIKWSQIFNAILTHTKNNYSLHPKISITQSWSKSQISKVSRILFT